MATGVVSQVSAAESAFEEQVIRKAFRRLITFLFIAFIFSMLDRVNIGFAALSMNRELKMTALMYGLSNTIFYVGYAAFEIPANVLLTKVGGRRWIATIMIVWGIAASACMFAAGPRSLYSLRFVLGIAESGFLPGTMLFLTFWFPPTFRARATSLMWLASPISLAAGAQLSGLILDYTHGLFGLSGWRWLFLIEGAPAVVLGIGMLWFLSDNPAKAKWLNDKEKAALLRRMEREQKAAPQHKNVKVWSEVFGRSVLILTLMDLGMVAGLNTMAVWTPQIVREVIKAHNFSSVGLFTAIPAVAALIAMPFWGSHSDRKMERSWHFAAPMAAAGVGWALVALSHRPEVRMLGLILCTLGPLIAQTIYWVIASHVMSPAARAVGFAFVNTCAMVAAAFMPLLVGFLRDRTHSWVAALLFTAFMLIMAAAVTFLIPANEGIRPADARS